MSTIFESLSKANKSFLNEGVEEAPKQETQPVSEGIEDLLAEGYEELTEGVTFFVCESCGCLAEHDGVCDECNEGNLEEAVKLVVKNGKVVKKQIKRKKKLSAKQKQALKKAQKKSHTASAKSKRAKSMKVRKRKIREAEEFTCPVCDYVGAMEEIEDGVFVCPECDSELEIAKEESSYCSVCGEDPCICDDIEEGCKTKKKKTNESLEVYKEILDIPSNVLNEGDESVIAFLSEEYGIEI